MYEKNYDGYCENIESHLKSDHHKETMIPLEILNAYKASLRHLERAENEKSEEDENSSPSSEIMEEEKAKDDPITYVAPKYYQGDLHFKFTLTTFLLEHNLPFSLGSELVDFINSLRRQRTTRVVI